MNNIDGIGTQSDGISRRNILKFIGAGTLYSMLPSKVFGNEFSVSKGRGLIFVVGDGMPLGVIRAMHEVRRRFYGDAGTNFYSRMGDGSSSLGYMGTASLSSIVTDSAPASVAWATGSKTSNRLLATLPDGRPLKTIIEILKDEGYAMGLVTTTRITHATPAAWVSHQMHRDLEDAIALDYLKFRPDVLLGGGSIHFDPVKRKDGRDLFKEFAKAGYDVVTLRADLLSSGIPVSKKPLIGLFNSSHISYFLDRANNAELGRKQPNLPEMTASALQRLSANPKGFILQVEAGRIDHASHSNDAWAAINDTYELDIIMGVIEDYLRTNPDTLVIVTSDHGNSVCGVNGTGPDYNDSTAALGKYKAVKASFEVIIKEMKGKTTREIKDIFEHYTSYGISDNEASMIYEAMQPGYSPYPGDFIYQPDAAMGKILSHSLYSGNGEKTGPVIRRGNVGFTSTNHTAEDQIVLSYGKRAKDLGLDKYIDNTYLFEAMCKYFGIKYRNSVMTEAEARPLIKTASAMEWERHMRLHIS